MLELAREEHDVVALLCLDGLPPPRLDAVDFALLEQWTARRSWREMALAAGVGKAAAQARMARPAFVEALTRLQRTFFDQLARGEFGVLALAKANAPGAFKRILALSRLAISEKVKLDANRDILALAGIQAPKPAVIESPDRLIDLMTADEAAHFAETNEFPRRLADKLARVAAGVLQERGKTMVEATVEVPDDDPPLEVPDDDGPEAWVLPDETEGDVG